VVKTEIGGKDMKINCVMVFKTDQGWIAKFTDPEVKRLFGSDTLPTGFTSGTDKATVHRAIKALNPDSYVHVY
jgi:hypothetical protein